MSLSRWSGKTVFVTGHTGFKGAWLCVWLQRLGARVVGFALGPPSDPNLFEMANVAKKMTSVYGDVRDLESLQRCVNEHQPCCVMHLAAQSLVRQSYCDPVTTYETNVLGTVNVLEAVRREKSVRAALIVTSDKCYENLESATGYCEGDPLGGFDPYSSSKGCAELVTAAYRQSFFSQDGRALVASARAGNVVGGGDWAKDRLIPDLVRAFSTHQAAEIRNPHAIRPWQHVLEPLRGYLQIADRLLSGDAAAADAWNFGPPQAEERPVSWVATTLAERWGGGAAWITDDSEQPHEAEILRLDSTKSTRLLNWKSRLPVDETMNWTADWYRDVTADPNKARALMEQQIERYEQRERA